MPIKSIAILLSTALLPTITDAASYGGGAGLDFSYTNASDLNGLFGMPIPAGNDIFFPFATFSASANSGNPNASASDTITIDFHADPGLRFDAVGFIFNGTRTINGSPGANSVQSDGELTVTALANEPFFGSDSYTFSDDQPGSAGAFWTEDLFVPIHLGTQVTDFTMTLSQGLVSFATDGSAQITATLEIVSGISLTVIPEPTSLALLGLGAFGLTHRRRIRK